MTNATRKLAFLKIRKSRIHLFMKHCTAEYSWPIIRFYGLESIADYSVFGRNPIRDFSTLHKHHNEYV